jgi:hypothetical protein
MYGNHRTKSFFGWGNEVLDEESVEVVDGDVGFAQDEEDDDDDDGGGDQPTHAVAEEAQASRRPGFCGTKTISSHHAVSYSCAFEADEQFAGCVSLYSASASKRVPAY